LLRIKRLLREDAKMARKLNARELHDGLLILAGLEKNAGMAETGGVTEEIIQTILENAAAVQQLDAESEMLIARLREKSLELDTRLAEFTKQLD
jgi:hypothetical protein